MVDEEIKKEQLTEPTFLEEMEKKKNEFAEIIRNAEGKITELKNLRAIEIMSGKSTAGNTEGPKELTNKEYAEILLKGQIPK